ncbi:hypothetical protein ACI65C_001098, partial [Semiaphis heraclei]
TRPIQFPKSILGSALCEMKMEEFSCYGRLSHREQLRMNSSLRHIKFKLNVLVDSNSQLCRSFRAICTTSSTPYTNQIQGPAMNIEN